MNRAQWVLITTFAASMYGVGNIWMPQLAWRLWPYVSAGDFDAYHRAWWSMIKPVVFPVAGISVFGSVLLIWLRPDVVTATPVWLNIFLHVATYALTIALWGRWQANIHYVKLPDGSIDPLYARAMSTHWIRALLITSNGLVTFWMVVQHISSKGRTQADPEG